MDKITVAERVERIPVDQVKPADDNPRRNMGDLPGLAMSIKADGVIEPIVVRRNGSGFELIAGARRLAAAQLAGLDTIPAIVRELDDQQRLVAMTVENLQREDLTPVEEAGAYQRLIDELGLSQRDLAPRVGKSQAHISKRLSLLALPADVRKQIDSGGITIPDALTLTKLAEHPELVKKTLAGPGYQALEIRVGHQLAELERDAKIVKLEEELESKGLRTIRVPSQWHLPKGVHRLKGGAHYDAQALQLTPAQHETQECHAIAIDENGLAFPVCTNRKTHPQAKTRQEADRARSPSTGKTPAFQRPRETPAQKQRRETRAKRLELAAVLVQKRPAKEAVRFVLRYFVGSQIEYMEGGSSLDRAAIWLGLVEAPADESTLLPDGIDVEALLTGFAGQGDAQLERTALALAAADVDDDGSYNTVTGYLDGHTYMPASAYLEFLRSQGYELAAAEQKRLDETAPQAAKAA